MLLGVDMPLSVAEYLGQRTDNTEFDIIPSEFGGNITPTCPFSGVACSKLHANNPNHPVCCVRTTDGRPFIVCQDRLIPSKAGALIETYKKKETLCTTAKAGTTQTSDTATRRSP